MKNKELIPSRKIILFIIAIFTGLGLFIFKEKIQNNAEQVAKAPETNAAPRQNNFAEQDSDNDGLKDWEEILWKTDPSNPDTDGDGTSDGEEVKQNRDPSVKGPDDKLSFAPALTQENASAGQESSRAANIQDVAPTFLIDYLNAKQGDARLNNSQKSELADALALSLQLDSKQDNYSVSDIKIDQNESGGKTKSYLNKIAEIINQDAILSLDPEPNIVKRALEKENPKELAKLEVYINSYEKNIKNLLALQAPQSLSQFHLELVNIFQNSNKAATLMRSSFNDPAAGLAGLKIYSEQILRAEQFLKQLSVAVVQNSIAFSPGEMGELFYQYFERTFSRLQ